MPRLQTEEGQQASGTVREDCPECGGDLAVLRVIAGRKAEYWMMRCIHCGGVHLNIVDLTAPRTLH
jgi:uncharacterized Zn finger protein